LAIAQKLGLTFIVLLVIATINVVVVDGMLKEADRVADTVNISGKLRMLGQRIALQVVNHSQEIGGGEAEIRQAMRDFESVMGALSDGGYVFGQYISGLPALHRINLDTLRDQWSTYKRSVHEALQEIDRVHASEADLPRGTYMPRGHLNMLLEDLTTHSSTLLTRAESLMTGILTDVGTVKKAAMQRMY